MRFNFTFADIYDRTLCLMIFERRDVVEQVGRRVSSVSHITL
jgi:hypothetical protein